MARKLRPHGSDHRGEKNPQARLTTLDVVEMRRANAAFVRGLAAEYGLSTSYVYGLLRGAHWKHLGKVPQ